MSITCLLDKNIILFIKYIKLYLNIKYNLIQNVLILDISYTCGVNCILIYEVSVYLTIVNFKLL